MNILKHLIIISLFLTTQTFANYAFSDEKSVKIDMHGGKSESFPNTNGFSKMKAGGLKGMGSFNIKEPKGLTKPEEKNIPELQDIELK